jgi:hypothetical protein
MLKTHKKGQEEMVGFVLIVVIVAIMGLVFLAFSMRQSGKGIGGKESAEMDDMLTSMVYYTTDCNFRGINQSINDLIKDCASGTPRECSTDNNSCDFLNATLKSMLNQFMKTESLASMPIHAYNLSFSSGDNIQDLTSLNSEFSMGNQTGNSFSTSKEVFRGSNKKPVIVKLRCWYSKEG